MAASCEVMNEYLVLVNEQDQEIGMAEKLTIHQQGLLHRAFSVFIFNQHKQLLLQQRAAHKYHSDGLWSNTCCGHPRPHENIHGAAERRLYEEMGFKTPLIRAGTFKYKTTVATNQAHSPLIEHEIDHVFYGFFDQSPRFNPQEVSNIRWITINDLLHERKSNPNEFTTWFFNAFDHLLRNQLSIFKTH